MKTWDTQQLAPRHRFGYWRDVLCEAFTALDSRPNDRTDAGSVVTLHELAEVNAADLASFSQLVVRGRDEIRRRADEYFFANLQLEGACRVEQDGRRMLAEPGSFYLVDTTRPYALGFEQTFRTLSFRFPHHQLMPLLGHDPRRLTATRVDTSSALGGFAIQNMTGAMRCAPQATPATARVLADTLARLIGASVAPDPAQLPDAARAQVRDAFHASIVRHVLDRWADPALSVARVAAHFRVSVRYVHEVFAAQPASFAQTVLEQRLRHAAHLLSRDAAVSVGDAADRTGFGDASYFARAFRRRFGCTPRDWRNRGKA
jgi:AraC-like DNA-binding protein